MISFLALQETNKEHMNLTQFRLPEGAYLVNGASFVVGNLWMSTIWTTSRSFRGVTEARIILQSPRVTRGILILLLEWRIARGGSFNSEYMHADLPLL